MDGLTAAWLTILAVVAVLAAYNVGRKWYCKSAHERASLLWWNFGGSVLIVLISNVVGLYVPFLNEGGREVGAFVFASAGLFGSSIGIALVCSKVVFFRLLRWWTS